MRTMFALLAVAALSGCSTQAPLRGLIYSNPPGESKFVESEVIPEGKPSWLEDWNREHWPELYQDNLQVMASMKEYHERYEVPHCKPAACCCSEK
jgi:hypothetical protein